MTYIDITAFLIHHFNYQSQNFSQMLLSQIITLRDPVQLSCCVHYARACITLPLCSAAHIPRDLGLKLPVLFTLQNIFYLKQFALSYTSEVVLKKETELNKTKNYR